VEYFSSARDRLCPTCLTRLERNPLRILDCKNESCREVSDGAPDVYPHLCDECRDHFDSVRTGLDAIGASYRLDKKLVRGLDYYTKTAYEILSGELGAQNAVCGGGRYDNLVEQLGGPKTPAVGFGLGMERLLLLLDQLGRTVPALKPCDLYIASIGAEAAKQAFLLAHELRGRGAFVLTDQVGRSAKAQFKYADKLGARNVLTIGDTELADKKANIKRLADGRETPVALDADTVYKAILEE
jgi:histidyl-tRNA synthetase